jgi:hypothetical protein
MDFDIEKMFLEVTFIGREIKYDFYRMKPLLIPLKDLGTSIRRVLSADHDSGAANSDDASVSSVIAYACGWFVTDENGRRPFGDTIRWADTSSHIT